MISAAGSGRKGHCESQRKYRAVKAPRSMPAPTSPSRTGTERQVHPRLHQGEVRVLLEALCDEPRRLQICVRAGRACELIMQTSGEPVNSQRFEGVYIEVQRLRREAESRGDMTYEFGRIGTAVWRCLTWSSL
jgi:hypothetical protein